MCNRVPYGWFEGIVNPVRPGVYRQATANPVIYDAVENKAKGWGYATWTGIDWVPYANWGRYYDKGPFVWCGLDGPDACEQLAIKG